jgi:hypothetical protein
MKYQKYQELFPYDFFFSRESIESDFTCSICGAKFGLRRNNCSHEVGEIYNGEMCCRIINKVELLGISIVRKPFDKYTILHAEGVEYNYYLLEKLMEYLDNPFETWDTISRSLSGITKNDPLYRNLGRNDKCPCGSEKKFKKCCMVEKKEGSKHYKFGEKVKNSKTNSSNRYLNKEIRTKSLF